LNLAGTLRQEGKAAEAAEIYRQYILKNPGDFTYIDAYASALETAGDLKKAEKEYMRAAEHKDCGTLSSLGRFYLHQKEFSRRSISSTGLSRSNGTAPTLSIS